MTTTMPKRIMFLACGSFSPPTPMHLRMFEIARDQYKERRKYNVIGGVISPVHDSYQKGGLVSATHRCAMARLALRTSDWIRLSEWESMEQTEWTRTRASLQYHQNYINSILNDDNGLLNENLPEWIPSNIRDYKGEKVQVKLLCGADLLESFSVPGLWNNCDLEAILGEHGVVVISRSGTNPEKFIFDSDLLTRHRKNITVVTNWVPNEVSSTMARRHLNRGLSVKYMMDDLVVDYIKQNKLYGAGGSETDKYILTPNRNEVIPNQPLSPGYISDNYIKKRINITNYNYDLMDETDYSSRKSFVSNNSNNVTNGRSKLLNCSGTNVRNFLNSRPGQAVQIRTDVNGASRVNKDIDDGDNNDDDDDDNEVGESKVSTVTLASNTKALDKKIASDTNLDKFINGTIKEKLNVDTDGSSLETLSVENLPTTSKRSQNDLIQFVFTSHGIRVISDKEYVV